ncbi:MAG: dihydroorotate dehydrogenase electron transfer subunit [Dehalococcoidaceae bacterium]|nr:dihydroorotate dehydrogenase electron transfer subunit [Dehalococcoidaceae bacterium]
MKYVSSPQFATVVSNEELYAETWICWLDAPSIAGQAQPGQFVMVSCGDDTILRRPLAVHQVNTESGCFALLFKLVGKGTRRLAELKTGQSVNLLGPMGNSYKFVPGSKNILLIAGGLGIAPIRFLAQRALETGKSVILLQGAPDADCLYPSALLPRNLKCHNTTEDGSEGSQCLVTAILHEYLGWADQLFACGPENMYHPIALQNNRLFRVKPFSISLEVRMGCGFGACYGCSIKTRHGMRKVCQDGPVFDYYEITWDKTG